MNQSNMKDLKSMMLKFDGSLFQYFTTDFMMHVALNLTPFFPLKTVLSIFLLFNNILDS